MIFGHTVMPGVLDCLSAPHDEIFPPDFPMEDGKAWFLGQRNSERIADSARLREFPQAQGLVLGSFFLRGQVHGRYGKENAPELSPRRNAAAAFRKF